jgi:monoamine oxidase
VENVRQPDSKYDVLVVGAGAAGLAAGRALADAGRRVAIVEARPRVGGRIFTQHLTAENAGVPIPVELGAEFIHGLPRATWALTEEAGLGTYELEGTQLRFAAGQLTAHSEQENLSRDVLEEMTAWVDKEAHGRDMTFAEYLERNNVDAPVSESAASYVEGFNAADRTRIGIAGLAKQQRAEDAIDADRLFRITGGYSAIPTYLAEEFARSGGNLMLGKPVQSVAWKRGAVAVRVRDATGGDTQLHAQRAVISVPLGVLQAESIDFAPRPADILEQAHRLVMGDVVRVVLLFRTRFWSERPWAANQRKLKAEVDHWSFLFTPSEVPATWWTPMPDRTPMITAWVGGPKAAVLLRSIESRGDRHALLDQCLTTLAKVFDVPLRDLKMLLLSWHTHDWQADEYARGAYSYVPAGALDAPERMTLPVEDTLYFTGEHTDTAGHWGTVHAALATGMLAARRILNVK